MLEQRLTDPGEQVLPALGGAAEDVETVHVLVGGDPQPPRSRRDPLRLARVPSRLAALVFGELDRVPFAALLGLTAQPPATRRRLQANCMFTRTYVLL